ncbi:MAG TPA: TraR/DksA family transcriptional regulator [Bdellovibrionota bacterium]|nr:TraR/DksA family transcriptional regulator [Bdellovibrionota bacterium]
MDGKTMEEVKQILLARWRFLAEGAEREQQMTENNQQAEIIDIAQGLEQMDREMSLAEQERKELVAIERALAKMATANYGTCEDCGEEIPPKRLVIVPEARLCANCQALEERQNQKTIRNRLPRAASR